MNFIKETMKRIVTDKKNVLILVLVYCLSQFMLIVISGQWWDDWEMWNSSIDELITIFSQAGSPWSVISVVIAMALPHWGYRIVVFLLFLMSYLLLYGILNQLYFLPREDAFWIAAVTITVPVNDARATLICFNYSVSLVLWLLAFFIVTRLAQEDAHKRALMRALSHLCLLCSYTTQSLLVFSGLIWVYLFYVTWRENEEKSLTKNLGVIFLKYWDYIINPFLFYIIKNLFFKPYAGYSGYNEITPKILIRGIIISPFVVFKTVREIFRTYFVQTNVVRLIFFVAFVTIYIIAKRKDMAQERIVSFENKKKNVVSCVIGMITLYTGLFAYIIVRVISVDDERIRTTGVAGRDSMLVGFGISIMIVSFLRFLPIKTVLQNVLIMFLIVFGIFHFYDWYLNYQEDWYFQQEFANAIADNNGFRDDNTILCDFSEDSPINGTRQYTLNGMYYMITGKKDKSFYIMERLPHGMDYNSDDCNPIDGVLMINNSPISNIRLLQIRMHESFAPEKYREDIRGMTDYSYKRINKDISDSIYRLNNGYELNSDVLRILVQDSD